MNRSTGSLIQVLFNFESEAIYNGTREIKKNVNFFSNQTLLPKVKTLKHNLQKNYSDTE